MPNPTVGAFQVTPSQVVDGVTVAISLTPALRATVTDPAAQPLRAEFEVEHDPAVTGQGEGQIWAGGLDGVASGTQATATVPAGKLNDGWKIRWRARAVAADQSSEWSIWQPVTVKVPQPGSGPFARTAAAVIRTDQDFTVGAWLKFSDKDGSYTVMEQKGTHQAPFRLGNDPDHGLVFTFSSADAADATTEGVLSDVDAPVNEWFHLAGVYTQNPSTATLYLNGLEIGTSALGFAAWNAAAPLTLGTAMTGSLDEVWVYDVALVSDEVFDLMDGSPTADGAAGTPLAKSAAPVTPRYDRLSPEDCWKNHGYKKRTYGYMKNRYSGCMIHEVPVFTGSVEVGVDGYYGNITPDIDVEGNPEWLGRMMLVARSWNGPQEIDAGATARDIWFDLYVGHRKNVFWEDASSTDLTLGLRPAYGQSACKDVTIFNGGSQKNHLTMDVEDWREKADETDDGEWTPLATFRFRAASADAPAYIKDRTGTSVSNGDKISNCVFKPYIKIENTGSHAVIFEYGTIEEKAQITCDSSHSVGAWNGCTLPVLPSIEWKLDGTYDAAYKHYYKACYDRTDTYPKDTTKTIPGCAVNRTNRPPKEQYLWRVSDPAAKNTNARARARCHSLWLNFSTNGQECDEYPFASAGNRTKDTDNDRNFSVCAMTGGTKGPNYVAGMALRRFQKKDRLLYGQDFFNRFSTELQTLPAMDSICWKPANTGSMYWADKQKD
ncbi:hypothetical protein FAF44_04705 [Nonomuraea sp. MG754425]|uniref:LamG domain-containing protein n=1 Tax=Nonomuraea sp. MG754425 TaxID=2570319 RepID=UPI001F33A12F|nr:LamG domain-containing protein [Nonomuraea sp. MG754425]MCF6467714.1 hypothetical protein [Nonomuraea sp. MG754425]